MILIYEGWNKGPDGEFFKQKEVVYTRRVIRGG